LALGADAAECLQQHLGAIDGLPKSV
jgi:hypothetical protein